MRLLNVDTLTFKEFVKDPPPYVIASHRWVDEATHQDVLNESNTDKPGYRKIENFCSFVNKVNYSFRRNSCPELKWLWIDTCCINKSDFTELHESINSMFRWYQQAALCVAFLHDVPSSKDTPKQVLCSLKDSVWFRRGWTLQELLAPQIVVLLNDAWEPVGHKACRHAPDWFSVHAIGHQIHPWLSAITDIPDDALRKFSGSSSKFSGSEKKRWMEARETAREEDWVYCQLGIYDVFMSLIYGEGVERAWARLVREVQNQQDQAMKAGREARGQNSASEADKLPAMRRADQPPRSQSPPRSRSTKSFSYLFHRPRRSESEKSILANESTGP